jgi:hypothetical protein
MTAERLATKKLTPEERLPVRRFKNWRSKEFFK